MGSNPTPSALTWENAVARVFRASAMHGIAGLSCQLRASTAALMLIRKRREALS